MLEEKMKKVQLRVKDEIFYTKKEIEALTSKIGKLKRDMEEKELFLKSFWDTYMAVSDNNEKRMVDRFMPPFHWKSDFYENVFRIFFVPFRHGVIYNNLYIKIYKRNDLKRFKYSVEADIILNKPVMEDYYYHILDERIHVDIHALIYGFKERYSNEAIKKFKENDEYVQKYKKLEKSKGFKTYEDAINYVVEVLIPTLNELIRSAKFYGKYIEEFGTEFDNLDNLDFLTELDEKHKEGIF